MTSSTRTDANETILPLSSEEVSVIKQQVRTTTRDHVRTSEAERPIDESLADEHVEIERVAVNRAIDAVPEVRTEGDVTIIPVVREELIVQRRLILTEEVRLRRVRSTRRHREVVRLRHQEVDVEQLPTVSDSETDIIEGKSKDGK